MKVLTPSARKRLFRGAQKKIKLTRKDIKAIRKLKKAGTKQKDIAPQFKISESYLSRILSGEAWSHV